ncbi:MAG: flagellar basal body rod protein FlgC [Clostridiales bacterium]|nr:flagellar basal body rod protein FlgC [Clostridiales bacterium]
MGFCSSLDIVGSALTAERFRTEIITQNLANAETTETSGGEPYRRQQVVMQEIPLSFADELGKAKNKVKGGVKVSQVVESDRDFIPRYEPDNPNADENGYVLYPNVDRTEEIIDLMAAGNAYEANLTALSVVKVMINKAIDMGR